MGLWVLAIVSVMSFTGCASKGAGQDSQGTHSLVAPVSHLSPEQSRLYDNYFLEAMVQRQKGNNDAASCMYSNDFSEFFRRL